MSEKILYITDLDGTLLTSEPAVPDYTAEVVNRVREQGILFTYATARAYATASKMTRDITPRIPAVVFNGTFIVDGATGRRISAKYFSHAESEHILGVFADCGISPIVYGDIGGAERYSFCRSALSDPASRFIDAHRGDPRENPVNAERLGEGEVFHFTCIGEGDRLASAYEVLRNDFPANLYLEQYLDEMFLEIHPKGATKAEGVLELKRILGCDWVVCFGDGRNDIPMFRIADECYAMANADPELKRIATGVIGDNDDDGVAKWLERNVV